MKFFKVFLCIFILIFSYIFPVFADDEFVESEFDISSVLSSSSTSSNEPIINSRSAIVLDRNSKLILYGKNENEKRKMASTTKIMTAIIVIENTNLEEITTISSKAAGTGGSRLGLHKNDKISIINLLYGLLLCSGNDAAVALAEFTSGSVENFSILMNNKATELGLTSTHFVTPHGLDNDDHYTTAYELALLADYALKNKTFSNIVKTKNYTIQINNSSKTLSNTNELLGTFEGVYGVKTGFTNGANRCLVTAVKRNNLDLICIVLGADTKKDRTQDSVKLIEYAYKNFELVNVKEKINTEFENWKLCNSSSFYVSKGKTNNLEITLEDLPYDFLPVNSNQINDISIYIYCNTNLTAPLLSNTSIGYISLSINGNNLINLNIYNVNNIEKNNCLDFFNNMIKNYTSNIEFLFYKNPI